MIGLLHFVGQALFLKLCHQVNRFRIQLRSWRLRVLLFNQVEVLLAVIRKPPHSVTLNIVLLQLRVIRQHHLPSLQGFEHPIVDLRIVAFWGQTRAFAHLGLRVRARLARELVLF